MAPWSTAHPTDQHTNAIKQVTRPRASWKIRQHVTDGHQLSNTNLFSPQVPHSQKGIITLKHT